jgi:hypothetical protein
METDSCVHFFGCTIVGGSQRGTFYWGIKYNLDCSIIVEMNNQAQMSVALINFDMWA